MMQELKNLRQAHSSLKTENAKLQRKLDRSFEEINAAVNTQVSSYLSDLENDYSEELEKQKQAIENETRASFKMIMDQQTLGDGKWQGKKKITLYLLTLLTLIIYHLVKKERCGFLYKQGAVIKSWKRRWFVFKPNLTMSYYKNVKDKAPIRVVDLKGGFEVTADKNSPVNFCFKIATRTRTYYFSANNADEVTSWTNYLKQWWLVNSNSK